ncbi:MAG: 50S ribosomal protein L35 [Candidatus Nealsonbacteria bacterium RIFOXYB1_FULL_40_15]|uniref:50S ribosomal protein L35 n=2 Tax=Candidatus Nealsoniibacteriota TaxID=1817911 RepID=A0A1G2EUQ6_9BACT|nr:MAG: 50S ribosomal protein L35 [Candidatus Nealsonbacteria bacterium RIFOXYB1_FULL_40_15]OGZ28479.1 MAG: 50S ribosomal protein L35 [Candidatus Nealsonbacteria bacterium RIFOXYD1_FULL_39_11]OGZ29090.1 MAG: 50S ribosomal protein L35 [Candidatus Nealsonbacteria bacterium RIFOXYC1_FULL_40_7]
MKTRKSITKRFRITKNGKILRRAVGQDHFRAKKSGNKKRKGRKWVLVSGPLAKKVKQLIR